MEHKYTNTKSKKNKHLTLHDRFSIEMNFQDHTTAEIANFLGRSQRTIQRELKRGMTKKLEQGKVINVYDALKAQENYESNKNGCGRKISLSTEICTKIAGLLKKKKYSQKCSDPIYLDTIN